jgi:hypothetical protein
MEGEQSGRIHSEGEKQSDWLYYRFRMSLRLHCWLRIVEATATASPSWTATGVSMELPLLPSCPPTPTAPSHLNATLPPPASNTATHVSGFHSAS